MNFLLLVIPNLLSIHYASAVDIISKGLHFDQLIEFQSPLSLNDIHRDEISNQTNHFNYYEVNINESYTNCDYLYITTCCDYMNIDTNHYDQQCNDSSLDTIIELYHQRKNQYHLLQNSYQYYHCNNPGKSFIDLYGYNQGQYIISVEGFGEEFGSYSVAFICENDIETSTTENHTEPKYLYIVALIFMIISALFGICFITIIITSAVIRLKSSDLPLHNQKPVHLTNIQQTSTLSLDVNADSLNQNPNHGQLQQYLTTNNQTNKPEIGETKVMQQHSQIIADMFPTAPSIPDAATTSSLPIAIVTSTLDKQKTESEQLLSEDEEEIKTKKSPVSLDSIRAIIHQVSYHGVDQDDDDVKYLERNQSIVEEKEEDIVGRIPTAFPSPLGVGTNSQLEMSIINTNIIISQNTESEKPNNDSTRSLPLPRNAQSDRYIPNLSQINEGRTGNLDPRGLFKSRGKMAKSVSENNILDLATQLPSIPDLGNINYDQSADIWKKPTTNNHNEVSPTSKAAVLSNPECVKNKCREKINIIDQMQFNIKAGGIDIYQVFAIRVYYAMKWKTNENISWTKIIFSEHLSSLGRLCLVFLMQTLFLLAVDVYLLYDFIKVGKCRYDLLNVISHSNISDNDAGIHLCVRGVAFILSLLVIMKINKLFDDITNRGLYRGLRKYDSDLIYPGTEWVPFWLRFGQTINWIASVLCIIGSFAIIFDTRDRSIDENGTIDIIAAGVTMILKILSIFYIVNIDSQFILVHEKLICIRYLDERKSEIKNPLRCKLWENSNSTCCGYKANGEKCAKCCSFSYCFKGSLMVSRFVLYLFGAIYAGFVWVCW